MQPRQAKCAAFYVLAWLCGQAASAPHAAAAGPPAWADKTASPGSRAGAIVAAMTRAEKLQLVISNMAIMMGRNRPPDAVMGAGYIPGITRFGLPALQETDASLGVANFMNMRHDDVATALPSSLALAAGFDTETVRQAGAMIGSEARAKRFNVMLAGGVNLTRDPRGGRTFEYGGEDPLLAGMIAGAEIAGIQSNGIVSTIKHFALNDQDDGRMVYDARIGEAAGRESDLLAFEIGIEQGHPGAVMSAYNKINGAYASENSWLLNDVLKRDWHFPGWVMSDWGSVHSTVQAAMAGLDHQSGAKLDKAPFFGAALAQAVANGSVPPARLDDMARRILVGVIAAGLLDRPADAAAPIDYAAHAKIAQLAEERGIVLLKNAGALLPLPASVKSIAVIGGHADVGVLAGGGSSMVRPARGPALQITTKGGPWAPEHMYDPSSPLVELKAAFPQASVQFDDGTDPKRAAGLAGSSQIAIVFAEQWRTEMIDAPSMALPDGQDALIEAVSAANPKVIVVLETGGPVAMPWLDHVGAVLEAWFPGQRGGAAVARVVSGAVNPSGHLPLTFPQSEAQLPRPTLDGAAAVLANSKLAFGNSNAFPPVLHRLRCRGCECRLPLVHGAPSAPAISLRAWPILHEVRV